jgi:hypothetical protein
MAHNELVRRPQSVNLTEHCDAIPPLAAEGDGESDLEKERRLEYAFGTLRSLFEPPVFHFRRIKDSFDWLMNLSRKGMKPEPLRIVLTKESVFLLVELTKTVWSGETAPRCKIWITSSTDNNGGFDFWADKMKECVQGYS